MHKQRTTINDVARQAGVSAATVSNLLTGKGRLGDSTRLRIQTAMDELHFTPNALVRALRDRRTNILGLLMYELDSLDKNSAHSLVVPLLAGIYEAANAAGQDILLYTGWPERPTRSSGRDFLNGHVDGLLWLTPEMDFPRA